MNENGSNKKRNKLFTIIGAVVALIGIGAFYFNEPSEEIQQPVEKVEIVKSGIDSKTGFIEDEGMQTVINNCTTCHAAELVTQNKMTREGWLTTIRWMQKTQNLWDLGANEEIILTYLAKNYAPEDTGRRPLLKNIEWYVLKQK